jgi:ribosomal protein S24E
VHFTNSFEYIKSFYFEVVPSPTNLEENQKNENENDVISCNVIIADLSLDLQLVSFFASQNQFGKKKLKCKAYVYLQQNPKP